MAETLKVSSLSKAMVLTILATPASLLASIKATPTMATDPATITTPAVNAATKAPTETQTPDRSAAGTPLPAQSPANRAQFERTSGTSRLSKGL